MSQTIKTIQIVVAFITGNQIVHCYMDPLGNIQQLVDEKKHKLWQEYLKKES